MKDRKFFAAVMLAAIFGPERFGLKACLLAVWDVLLAVTSRRGKAKPDLVMERWYHCQQCALFYGPLRTCGSPLADNPGEGCWCHMPTKATNPNATCWADENTDLNLGWKQINQP